MSNVARELNYSVWHVLVEPNNMLTSIHVALQTYTLCSTWPQQFMSVHSLNVSISPRKRIPQRQERDAEQCESNKFNCLYSVRVPQVWRRLAHCTYTLCRVQPFTHNNTLLQTIRHTNSNCTRSKHNRCDPWQYVARSTHSRVARLGLINSNIENLLRLKTVYFNTKKWLHK